MIIMMMKAFMVKMALSSIAMLAGKALMVAIISFVITSIMGIKKLSQNQGETKVEIVKYPSYSDHTGQYDRRTLYDDTYGQTLAYKRHS